MLTEYSSPSYSSKSNGDSLFPYQLMQRQLEGLWRQSWTVWPSELADCLKAASCVLRNQERCGMYLLTVCVPADNACTTCQGCTAAFVPATHRHGPSVLDACMSSRSARGLHLEQACHSMNPITAQQLQRLAALPAHRPGQFPDQIAQLLGRLKLCCGAVSCGRAGGTLCCKCCS